VLNEDLREFNTEAASFNTTAARNPATIRFIPDDESLASFPGRSLALISPPGEMTLVFLEPASASHHKEDGANR
jgi:hypothetical protein